MEGGIPNESRVLGPIASGHNSPRILELLELLGILKRQTCIYFVELLEFSVNVVRRRYYLLCARGAPLWGVPESVPTVRGYRSWLPFGDDSCGFGTPCKAKKPNARALFIQQLVSYEPVVLSAGRL